MTATRKVAMTGASFGIGAETAAQLRAKGYSLFGTSRCADGQSSSFEELHVDGDCVNAAVAEVLSETELSRAARGLPAAHARNSFTADAATAR